MKKEINLTDNQAGFLLDYFFKNEEFAGWANIATKLLTKGNCIVAGKKCIWKGGIGNFIQTEEADFIDCIQYTFDLEYFLSSEWFKEIHNGYIAELSIEKQRLEDKYNEIIKL